MCFVFNLIKLIGYKLVCPTSNVVAIFMTRNLREAAVT